MFMLCIEHPVPDYDRWKQAFDGDPVGREKMGVRRYQILCPVDKPNHVMINLEFATKAEAQALLAAMQTVWSRVAGTIMMDPKSQIVEVLQTKEY